MLARIMDWKGNKKTNGLPEITGDHKEKKWQEEWAVWIGEL